MAGILEIDVVEYTSEAMQKFYKEVLPCVNTAVPLVFWGESGVGMGFYARKLHEASRAEAPFLRKPGFELEEDSIRQQFLGIGDRTGWLEDTHNGTIFIERITKAPFTAQQVLAQIISTQTTGGEFHFSRTKNTESLTANVRFIFSMAYDVEVAIQDELLHRDLLEAIKHKGGRLIQVPPLRSRSEDIVAVAHTFFREFNAKYQQEISSIDPQAQKMLTDYDWPGNIEELRAELRAIFSNNPGLKSIAPEYIPHHIQNPEKSEFQWYFILRENERFRGKFHAKSFRIVKHDNSKIVLNTDDIQEILRIDDDTFSPPKLKHFTFRLKDGTRLVGNFTDPRLKVVPSSKAFDQIATLDLEVVTRY